MSDATPVVLVTGPPASGKTHVAELLATELRLPLVAKDAIKEVLYDSLGTGDVEWSRRLGGAAVALVHAMLEAHLRARQPLVLEANFVAEHARRTLSALRERYPFAPFEVHCTAREDVLVARYGSRIGTRHPGHLDGERLDEIATAIRDGRNGPLELGDAVVVLDTTEFAAVDLQSLVAAAREHVTARRVG